jgi:hypothetical protein
MTHIIEETIEQYKLVADEYSQWLGSLLRTTETGQKNNEWAKKMGVLAKEKAKGKAKKKRKKGKSKMDASTDWVQVNEIVLSASERGEAELLFEAIEEINRRVAQLEDVKESVELLEKAGFGKDITYITYICDGVPRKIVLRHRNDQDFAKKFQYIADFSISKAI